MLPALREKFRKSRNRHGFNAITKMLRTGSRVASARTGRVAAAEHCRSTWMEMEDTEGKREEPGGWTAPYWNYEFI